MSYLLRLSKKSFSKVKYCCLMSEIRAREIVEKNNFLCVNWLKNKRKGILINGAALNYTKVASRICQ